jgi:glycosyltransferase involved in cell wall biosynthesis
MNKLLTIVVPIYKVEEYINKCLDSLILSPELMSKMDVLIINDGTPDNSAELSREYVKNYPSVFRQIDKENGGHGSVWNMGVKEAFGKYTRFLDSDDWLENLDLLLEKLENLDADLVITPTIDHCENDEIWKQEILDMEFGKVYDANTFDWLGNRSHGNYIFHHSCTYKTEMFRQYLPLFLEKQPYDDVILGAASIIGAKSLVAYDFPLYHYLMDRPGQSISPEVQRRNICATIKTQQHTIEFTENHPVQEGTTKAQYFAIKLLKRYNYGYRTLLDKLPYKEAKQYSKEWDEWAQNQNPNIITSWIKAYRLMPFCIYWIGYKIINILYNLYKKIR